MFSTTSLFARAKAVQIGPAGGPYVSGRAFVDEPSSEVLGGMGYAEGPRGLVQASAHPGIARGWQIIDGAVTYTVRTAMHIDDGALIELQLTREAL